MSVETVNQMGVHVPVDDSPIAEAKAMWRDAFLTAQLLPFSPWYEEYNEHE